MIPLYSYDLVSEFRSPHEVNNTLTILLDDLTSGTVAIVEAAEPEQSTAIAAASASPAEAAKER